MNGHEIRHVRFLGGGYDADQVDDLLRSIAAELDAGRAADPLIASARFQWRKVTVNSTFVRRAPEYGRGYDTEAVDWFLDQLRRESGLGLYGMDMDPWRGLPVADYFIRPATDRLDGGAGVGSRAISGSGEPEDHEYFRDYQDAWRDFGQQPGTRLRWGPTGILRHELRTAERQGIASVTNGRLRQGGCRTVRTGGRTFTWKRVPRSKRPDLAKLLGPGVQESEPRRYAADRWQPQTGAPGEGLAIPMIVDLGELVDRTGTPVLYTSGQHFDRHAGAVITFPDRRRLLFPVRGEKKNAIMTAVDQAGNKVARYRFARKGFGAPVEITVHPGRQLTEELVLAIAVSVPWLRSFFQYTMESG